MTERPENFEPDGIKYYAKELDKALSVYLSFLRSELCDPERVNRDGMRDLIEEWYSANHRFLEEYSWKKFRGSEIHNDDRKEV